MIRDRSATLERERDEKRRQLHEERNGRIMARNNGRRENERDRARRDERAASIIADHRASRQRQPSFENVTPSPSIQGDEVRDTAPRWADVMQRGAPRSRKHLPQAFQERLRRADALMKKFMKPMPAREADEDVLKRKTECMYFDLPIAKAALHAARPCQSIGPKYCGVRGHRR